MNSGPQRSIRWRCARLWLAMALAFAAREFACAQDATSLSPITTAVELRRLTPEEAAEKRPVKLRAVVTLVAPERTVFLHDSTGPAFMSSRPANMTFKAGQLLEVEGVSYPGLYVTGLSATKVTLLGEQELPKARPITFAELASGRWNYEWVEACGIVRSFTEGEAGAGVLLLAMGDGRLEIRVNAATAEEGARLVDAAVRVQGLAAGFINEKRQLVAPQIRIEHLSGVHVDEAAPADPWQLAETPAANLLRFSTEGAPGHRVKVRGVVTHHSEGRALFVRDAELGLFIETAQPGVAAPGVVVEALGFPEMGRYSAQLRDAIFRTVADEAPPEPVPVNARSLLAGTHDADLVRIEADLLEVLRGPEEFVLVLRAGTLALQARMSLTESAPLADLRPGSRLSLDGVARIGGADFRGSEFRTKPSSCELLLRRASDVRVLHAPPWWTTTRLATAAAALSLIVLAALAWVATLQRRVRQQTAIIGEKLKTEAALEERQRIAREFHDTLEQELVGLALRLDAAAPKVSDEKPRELLEGARRLVQRIQDEARGFLWNLRDRSLEATSLQDAIALAVADHRTDRTIEVRAEGEPRRLAGRVEHELLRLAQEAANNAARHGQALRIEIVLEYQPNEFALRITDDGAGFDPVLDSSKPGHFGLIGMQERTKRLGGTFALRSAPGHGTTVEVRIPT